MNAQLLSLFLQAVALVETGGNAHLVGKAGERGCFQMTPAVVASCGGYGEKEAVRWERHLERELRASGIEPIPFNLALAWNAGPSAVKRGAAPESSYHYARRVVATMEGITK